MKMHLRLINLKGNEKISKVTNGTGDFGTQEKGKWLVHDFEKESIFGFFKCLIISWLIDLLVLFFMILQRKIDPRYILGGAEKPIKKPILR